MNIKNFILKQFQSAFFSIGIPKTFVLTIQKSSKKEYGDYFSDSLINISKKMCVSVQELAQNVINAIKVKDFAQKIEIVEQGFINIFLKKSWIIYYLNQALNSQRLGISYVVKPEKIVLDYSSPNMAKEMHVGHLRSTVIGDAIARILLFLGHDVIRSNHIGDWGIQFGMLMAYLEKKKCFIESNTTISDLDNFYRDAKKNYDNDNDFVKKSQEYLVKLQSKNSFCLEIWKKIVDISIKHMQGIYKLLNIDLTFNDIMGESTYNNMLPFIVNDLQKKRLAVKKEGVVIVYLEEFRNRKGQSMGIILQKKSGIYLYITIDIACVKYRYEKFKVNRIIYYIDSRQNYHLKLVWAIVRKANYIPDTTILEHHMFGMILNKQGKPFKTRLGNTIKLKKLLYESINRARLVISMRNSNMLNDSKIEELSRIIGIGSLKYYDLSKNRNTDYVFDWDKVLSFEGNTAIYILYAYTRINSILKKNEQFIYKKNKIIMNLITKEEIRLSVCLLQMEETLFFVSFHGFPHVLCMYLYEVAMLFSSFYESCTILVKNDFSLRESRINLSLLTSKILKKGLELLGIDTVEYM